LKVLSASGGGGDVTPGQVEASEKVLLAVSERSQEQVARPLCVSKSRQV